MNEPISSPEFNPWWRIWVQPRQTIRYLINTDPKMHFWVLAIMYGIIRAVTWSMDVSLGDYISPSEVAGFILFGGALAGVIGIYLTASLLELTARLLGGKAEGQHVRAVLAWAGVPMNALVIIGFIPLAAMFSTSIFTSTNPKMQQLLFGHGAATNILGQGLLMWRTLMELIGALYYLGIIAVGLSEVEEFNIWKSIGILAIVFGGLFLMLLCLALASNL